MTQQTPPEAPDNEPAYRRFDTEADFRSAVTDLLAAKGRELRIFDPDLRSLQVNTPVRVAQFADFLEASRTRRLMIVVHDPGPLVKHCPRMMDLISRYAHAIQVHRTYEEIRDLQDAFLVLDAHSYVRRPVARFFRGAIGLFDETEALAMRSRFTEIWSASYPAVSGTTLGL